MFLTLKDNHGQTNVLESPVFIGLNEKDDYYCSFFKHPDDGMIIFFDEKTKRLKVVNRLSGQDQSQLLDQLGLSIIRYSQYPPSSNRKRLTHFGFGCAIFLLLIFSLDIFVNLNPSVQQGKAKEVTKQNSLNLILGQKNSTIVGSAPFIKSVRHEAVYHIDLKKGQTGHSEIQFQVLGLSYPNRITMTVNGRPFYRSRRDENCLQRACDRKVRVPKSVLKVGKNTIRISNNDKRSSWAVGNITYLILEPLTLSEVVAIDRYLLRIEDLNDKTHLSTANIFLAKKFIETVERITTRRIISTEKEALISALKKEIGTKVDTYAERQLFILEKFLRSGNLHRAKNTVRDMQQFFPSSESKIGEKIAKIAKSLERVR